MNASQDRSATWSEPMGGHIAVALIPKAGAELSRLKDRTSMSGADVVNRAIISYAFLDAQLRDGQDLLIRDSGARRQTSISTGEEQPAVTRPSGQEEGRYE